MWYVLRVPPTKEMAAHVILERRGYKTMLPTEERAYKKRNRREHVLKRYPIMSGYVIAQLPEPVNWHTIMSIPCIRGVIGWDNRPRPVPYERLEELMRRTGQYVSHVPGRRSLRKGDIIRVIAGAWTGWETDLKGIHEGQAKLVVQLFNRPAEIMVPLEQLEAA